MATRIVAFRHPGLVLAFVVVMARSTFFRAVTHYRLSDQTHALCWTQPKSARPACRDCEIRRRTSRRCCLVNNRWIPGSTRCVALYRQATIVPFGPASDTAEAQFTRTGRWELVLVSGGAEEVLAFVLRD